MSENEKFIRGMASAASAAAHVINNLNNLPPDDWAGPSIKIDRLKRHLDDALTDRDYEEAFLLQRAILVELMALRLFIRSKISEGPDQKR